MAGPEFLELLIGVRIPAPEYTGRAFSFQRRPVFCPRWNQAAAESGCSLETQVGRKIVTRRGELMKIALLGATGMIGQRVPREALERGHSVTAIARDPSELTENTP